MTELHRPYRDARRERIITTQLLLEYGLVLAFFLLIGALALAEVAGVLDTFVHDISFV